MPYPWPAHPVVRLPCHDFGETLESEADIVKTIKQGLPSLRIDIECDRLALRRQDHLLDEVNRERCTVCSLAGQLRHRDGREHNRQHAVLKAVVVEDIAKTLSNHAAQA